MHSTGKSPSTSQTIWWSSRRASADSRGGLSGSQEAPHGERHSPVVVGKDPYLDLKTSRGTGYYSVPSLDGVWYRTPFEHNGSVAKLEDWFDPQRLTEDHVPTAFRGVGVK